MRYRVRGHEIRSENAAKPMSQASKHLVAWLAAMGPVDLALDYGCGKLRYAHQLARKCLSLTLVDSAVQFTRVQVIGNEQTTVPDYVAGHLPNARVVPVELFANDKAKYTFALCANVLSAIPSKRTRSVLLSTLHDKLKRRGQCLLTTQYRNTYFRDIRLSPRSQPHLDGWIVPGDRGTAYYGILNKESLARLARQHGFLVQDSWTRGESAYCLIEKRGAPSPSGCGARRART